MIISFSYHVLVCPDFIIIVLMNRFLVLGKGVTEITELKCIVIVSPIFLNAYELSLWEYEYLWLISFWIFEIKIDISYGIFLKIPDENVIFSCFQHHHLSLGKHTKGIDVFWEYFLLYHFTIGVHMSQTILSMPIYP